MDTTDPHPGRAPVLLILVILLSIGIMIPFMGHCALYVQYPFSLDETEGYVLGQVERLSSAGRLYGPITEYPYVVDNYPPAFPVLLNGLENALGREFKQRPLLPKLGALPEDEASVGVKAATFAHNFPLIRTFMLLVLAGLLTLLAVDWRRNAVPWIGVGLTLALFCAQPAVFFMATLARADWLALTCGFGALVLGHLAMKHPESTRPLIAAAIVGVLAGLFRQSAIVPLIAIAITLFLAKDRRLKLFLAVAAISGLILAIGLHFTYGAGMWTHLITYTKTRWLFERLIGTLGFFFRHSSLLLVLSAMAWTAVRRADRWSLPVVYAPLALATALLSGKVGSDMNYFLEPILGCIWVTGYAMRGWTLPESQQLPSWALVGIGAVLLQSGVVQNPREGSYRPTRFDLANGIELLMQLQKIGGPVLSEEEGMLALAGKPVWYNPFIMAELEREGLWDDAPVVAMIEQQQLPVVITLEVPDPQQRIDRGKGAGWDRWTPGMLDALSRRYRPVMVVPVRREWIILVPRTGEAQNTGAAANPLQSTPE